MTMSGHGPIPPFQSLCRAPAPEPAEEPLEAIYKAPHNTDDVMVRDYGAVGYFAVKPLTAHL